MATGKAPSVKGILKHTSSLDRHDPPLSSNVHASDEERKQMKWDEMNILATNHPPDKDYGHMKIDEPPTPYSKYSDPEDDDMEDLERRGSVGKLNELDTDSLTSKLANAENTHFQLKENIEEEDSSSDEDDEMDEKQREEHASFELKRKLHYNEYQAVQLAKRLMAEEDDDDDDDTSTDNVQHSEQTGSCKHKN